jgi:DNA-binding MarR family transcriptional regulator
MAKSRAPANGADESRCSCTALRKATRRISQLYDGALAPGGLKTTQRAILAQIDRSEPAAGGSLAEALVIDSGAFAHTLKPLERDGFVTITVDPNDRRNRLISLTPAFGQAQSRALWKAMKLLISDASKPGCPLAQRASVSVSLARPSRILRRVREKPRRFDRSIACGGEHDRELAAGLRGRSSRSHANEVSPGRNTLRTVLREMFGARAISLIVLPLTHVPAVSGRSSPQSTSPTACS